MLRAMLERAVPDTVWAVALPLLACGLGMGCCFGSVFALALGDVRPGQAGSASGVLNAVQQIANAVGAALISTAYLAVASAGTAGEAVTASLVVVLVITALSLLALPLDVQRDQQPGRRRDRRAGDLPRVSEPDGGAELTRDREAVYRDHREQRIDNDQRPRTRIEVRLRLAVSIHGT
jgi:hypothetical protein